MLDGTLGGEFPMLCSVLEGSESTTVITKSSDTDRGFVMPVMI